MKKTKEVKVVEATDAETKAFLERYKAQSPIKYAKKLAEGKFKNFKLPAAYAVIAMFIIASAFIAGHFVKAYTSGEQAPKVVIENGNYIEAQELAHVEEVQEFLGASGVNSSVQPEEDNNGDVVWHLKQDFILATTTIISFPSPFLAVTTTAGGGIVVKTNGATPPLQYTAATATIEMARVYITTAATTSFDIVCGASDAIANAPVVHILGSGTIPTSTKATIENNITTEMGADVSGSTTQKIMITPNFPYVTCFVTAVNPNNVAGLSQTGRALDGFAEFRISRHRF